MPSHDGASGHRCSLEPGGQVNQSGALRVPLSSLALLGENEGIWGKALPLYRTTVKLQIKHPYRNVEDRSTSPWLIWLIRLLLDRPSEHRLIRGHGRPGAVFLQQCSPAVPPGEPYDLVAYTRYMSSLVLSLINAISSASNALLYLPVHRQLSPPKSFSPFTAYSCG